MISNRLRILNNIDTKDTPRAILINLRILFLLVVVIALAIIQHQYVMVQIEHTASNKHRSISLYVLIVALLLFLLLLSWTMHQFWSFIRKHQAIAIQLQTSERRHRTLLDAIPDIVLRRTRDGYYTEFKPAKSFGRFMPEHDFIGKHVDEILTPDIAQLSTDAAIAALDSGNEQIYQYRMPNRLTGAPTDYEARVTPCGEDEVQVIIRDITEEKLRIERQQQAQRLESLGMLAGGIAHDFNNLLTSIMAQTSLANAKLMRNQQPFEQLERAQMATQRAADLTRQLLAYAGKTVVEVAAIDLNQLIRDNVALLETALPVSAELRLKLTDQAVIIQADRGHIQQVVMNITINAADALRHSLQKEAQLSTALAASQNMQTFVLATQPNKARFIAIHTTITEIDSPQQHLNILGNELAPGHYVSLKVEDNGIGMDEATIKQVFDPFFSTKEQGHGLGLSATLGIMRSYGGAIYVESTLGSGTVFTLLFPTIQVVPREHKKGLEMHKATKNEVIFEIHPTVLVIDDELSIREVVTDILQMKGFTIYQAANGEEGIKQLQKYQNTIDLVLLDMKMPGLSGDETLTYIRQLQPSLKVILSSGFTQTDVGSKLKNNTVSAFLPKPYSQEQLLHTIYQVLAILPQVRPT